MTLRRGGDRLKPSSDLMEMVIQFPLPSEDNELLLQPDERTMARFVAMGVPDRQIAGRLGLSEDQVRDQLLVIFKKLAVAGLLDQLLYIGDQA